MAKKSSSVSRAVKKTARGEKSMQSRTGIPKITRGKLLRPAVDVKRQLKIQKALYEIADAASAVRDMQSFYKKLHKIVGRLMYAENFIIVLYDPAANMRSFPYYVDSAGDVPPPPGAVPPQSMFAEILSHPRTLHFSREQNEEAIRTGKMSGTPSEDFIAVPLTVDHQIVGGIIVQSYIEGIGYSDEDVRVLEFVAQHIAAALTRARALEAERRRTEELAIVNVVQEGLASKLDMQAIYDLIGDKIRDIFDAETIYIVTVDEKTNLTIWHYLVSFGQRYYNQPSEPPRGFGGYVHRTHQPLLLTNVDLNLMAEYDSNLIGNETEENITRSWMGVPLFIGQEPKGVISIQNRRANAFTESDLRLLQTLANSMSVALQNAQSFKAEQERVAELAIINSVQTALASKLDFQSIVDSVGDKLTEIFHAANVGIGFLDQASGMLKVPYVFENGKRIENFELDMNKGGLIAHMFKTREPLVINNEFSRRAEEIGTVHFPGEDPADPKSWLSVPIFHGDEVMGGISLRNWQRENAFSDSDIRLLQTLAGGLGVALENARLFDETQRLLKETEQRAA